MAERILFYEAGGQRWYADLDLGDGHYLEWSWRPREPGRPPDERPVGAVVYHRVRASGEGYCPGAIAFESGYGPPTWTVESWDPLTVSPSLLCHCGDHGFIREGRWVRA